MANSTGALLPVQILSETISNNIMQYKWLKAEAYDKLLLKGSVILKSTSRDQL